MQPRRLRNVRAIYDEGLEHLRDAMQRFVAGASFRAACAACYPFRAA